MALKSILAPFFACLCAPLFLGIIAKTKAWFAGRKGPPLFQTYYDLIKLFKKGAVYSTTSSWIFKAGPIVSLAAVLTAILVVPCGPIPAPFSFTGDILLCMFLLAIARFFTVIAALDTGSPFEGMGASREVFFSSLVEPIFLLCMCALARSAHAFSFCGIFTYANTYAMIPAVLAGGSLFVVMLAENARIPVDDPATHLELTMIHEVMVLDHSGPDFGFITYGASIKLWLFGLIVSRTIFPVSFGNFAIDLLVTLCCMGIIAIAIGVVESVTARLRLLRVPQLLVGAFALALLALLAGEGARFL